METKELRGFKNISENELGYVNGGRKRLAFTTNASQLPYNIAKGLISGAKNMFKKK